MYIILAGTVNTFQPEFCFFFTIMPLSAPLSESVQGFHVKLYSRKCGRAGVGLEFVKSAELPRVQERAWAPQGMLVMRHMVLATQRLCSHSHEFAE